jgi:hypothetical protein
MAVDVFSTRNGFVSVNDRIQVGAMSKELKNSLWNVLCEIYFEEAEMDDLCTCVYLFRKWILRKPVDCPLKDPYNFMREMVITGEWYFVYDIIEFMVNYFNKHPNSYMFDIDEVANKINNVLVSENAGYRLINGKIIQITDEIEMGSIKESLNNESENVCVHFSEALSKMSDRQHLDYRNSIKESISAVEYYLRQITKTKTLGEAIKRLEESGIEIPELLKDCMIKLYAFTNGKNGIRHALMEKTDVAFEEAKVG